MSGIGTIEAGWWHTWHFCWRIGATSFVKVTGLGPTAGLAAGAAERTAAVSADSPRAAILIFAYLFNGYLHEPVRPAALRVPRAADARRVVGAHADEVVPRRAERGLRGRLSAGHVHACRWRRECHRAGAREARRALMSEPRQRHRHGAASGAAHASCSLAVVARPHAERDWCAGRRRHRAGSDAERSAAFGAVGRELEDGRG